MRTARLLLGALFVLAARAQQDAPAGREEKPVIAGQVTSARTGLPLKKARVTLGSPAGEDQAEAAADGSFEFRDVEPGTYSVSAECLGYVDQRPATVTVAAGRPVKKLELKLVPHGILAGRVLDEDGQPLAGTAVRVLRYRFDPAARRRVLRAARSAFTDDLGRFRAWGLAPGRYYVKADHTRDRYSTATSDPQAPDAPGEGYKPTYYPGVDDSQQAAAVEVASGLETAGIEFKLILSRMFRVRGRVLDAAGAEPRRNVRVVLLPRDLGWRAFEEAHGAASAADGSFEIGGVSPGAYRLQAWRQPNGFQGSEEIEVADRNLSGLVLRLGSGFELSGLATVEGRSDFRLQNANVSLWMPGENRGVVPATINEDGTFTIRNVAPGRYRMRAWAEQRAEVYLKSARFGPDDVLDGELDLRHAPDPAARLELVFSPRPASLKGAVTDDDNKPVPDALVVLLPESAQRDQFERYGLATADQDGRYTVTTRPGEYQAVALEGFEFGEWLDPAVAEKVEKNAVAVTLGEGSREVRNLKVTRPENR